MRLKYLLIILIFSFSFSRLSAQITGDSVPCYGSQQVYSFTGSSYGFLFWSVTIGNITYNLTNDQFLVQWQQAGTFVISCIYNNSADTAYDTIHVQPLPSPLITALNSQGGCVTIPGTDNIFDDRENYFGPTPGNSVASSCYSVCDSGWYLYKAHGWAGSHFSWSTPGANALALSSTTDTVRVDWMAALSPQNTTLQNTSLTLIEISTAGCRDSSSICIAVNGRPHACFTSSPSDSAGVIRLCSGSTVSFSDSCSWVPQWLGDPGAIINRTWLFGDGTAIENESTVTHLYSHSGTYLVQYIAQSNCYCSDTFHMLVRVDSLAGPQIECVSTVCHNTWATYYVPDTCSHHFTWTVTGADSISASNDSLFVLWGSCNGGFGTISVMTDCPAFCPYQTTVRVPVVPDSATITGERIVCLNDDVTYSVPSVPGMGYLWYSPDSIPGTYIHYSSHFSLNSELYTNFGANYTRFPDTLYIAVIYYNFFLGENCQGFSVLPVLVTTGIQVNFTKGDSVICSNDSLQLNAVNSGTGLVIACNWSVYLLRNDSLVDTTSNSSRYFTNNLSPGSYIIRAYSDTGKFCNVPVATLVTVLSPPPPVAAPVIGPDSVCPNILFTYYTQPTNLSQYYLQWNSVNGTPAVGSGGHFSVSWLTPLPDTLVVLQRMLQGPGCPSSAVKIPIYPFSALTPAIAGDTLVCSDATTLYSTGFSADNYAWSVSPASSGSVKRGEGSDSIAIQWNHFTTDTIAYLLLIGTKCGNADSCIIKIHIKPTPVPTISVSPASPICTGHSITFTSSLTGQYYVWSFGDGNTDTTLARDTTHVFSTDSSFVINLTIYGPSGCPGTSQAVTNINVLPSPAAYLSTPQLRQYCTSGWVDTFYVTLQNMSGTGFTYQFFYNLGAVGSPGTNSSYIANQFGSYYAVVTTSLGCSNPTDTLSVDSVCAGTGGCSSDYTISFMDPIYCDTVMFSTMATSPITILNWTFDDGTGAGSVSSVTHVYTKAGYYHPTVNATAPANGDGSCPIFYQTIDTIPLVPNFLAQFQCQGTGGMHIRLTDISTYINPVTSWFWNVNGVLKCTTQDVDTPMAAGTYSIQLVISDGPHTCSVSKTITVPSSAAASFSCVDSQCITNPVQFTATNTTNIISYLWDFGDTSYSALQNPSKVYATCPGDGGRGGGTNCSQLVTLTVTDKFGCQSSYSKNVYYFENSFAGRSVSLMPPSSELCSNTIEIITVEPNLGSLAGDSFKWSNHNRVSVNDTIHVTVSGNYTVTVSDANGCTVAPSQAATLIYNTIQGFISGDTLYCNNTNTNLNVFQGLQYQYYWLYTTDSTGPATRNTLPASSQSFTFSHIMNVDTFYYCKVWGVIRDSIGPGLYCEDTAGPLVVHTYPAIPNPYPTQAQCVLYQPAVFIETPPAGDFVLWNTGLVSDTLTTSIPGSYTAKIIDTNGCVSDLSAVFAATPGPSFDGLATGCYTFCIGDSPILYVPLNVENDFVEWIRNDTVLTEPSTFYALQPGVYQLVLDDENYDLGGCQDTSLPISINFVSCDSACFHHANIYCSNCYYDSSGGKRYIHLIIGVSDAIAWVTPITVTSANLTILNYYPNTFLPGTATTYLNIDALADTSAGSVYCVEVNASGCQQAFCVNTSSMGCTNVTPGRHGDESPRRRQSTKYRVINNK